jgi:hypothetical protein
MFFAVCKLPFTLQVGDGFLAIFVAASFMTAIWIWNTFIRQTWFNLIASTRGKTNKMTFLAPSRIYFSPLR